MKKVFSNKVNKQGRCYVYNRLNRRNPEEIFAAHPHLAARISCYLLLVTKRLCSFAFGYLSRFSVFPFNATAR